MAADHQVKSGKAIPEKNIVFTILCLVMLVACEVRPLTTMVPRTPLPSATIPASQNDPLASPEDTALPIPTKLLNSSPIPSPTATVNAQPTPTPLPSYQIPARYVLEGVFDYFQHTLSVRETVSYTNLSPDTLTDLLLIVEPNRWLGGFGLVSLSWQSGESITQYTLQDTQLRLTLPQGLAPGDEIGMLIDYNLLFPAIPPPSAFDRPQPYGYTARQTNIVDWYPYLPPYRPGEGWLIHKPGWFGEHQVYDIASFDVSITLAQPVKDLIIAASAPAEKEGDTYTYRLEPARTFALSASNEYVLQTTTAGNVTIYSYSFPYDKNSGQEVLHNTADALQVFSHLLVPYPHLTLSAVEADFFDGMEYEGLYFLSHGFYDLYDGSPKGYLTFIAAHETAHQWWYGLVGNDQALEPWLDEALCTYMEHFFYENAYADYTTDAGQSMLDWWWYYRVNFYEPDGWLDGTIYDFGLFRAYRNAIYLRGAEFLHALRLRIGDQVFFAFLSDYASQKQHQLATASDFFTILREHTAADLDDLMTEYFRTFNLKQTE